MKLNKQQLKAVNTDSKRVLVLAGPGSGKTRVIVERVRTLIQERGFSGYDILLLTFTRKASLEMKTRLIELLGERETEKITVSTFHSVCLKILKHWGEKLGYNTKKLTVYDDVDQRDLLKDIIESRRKKIKKQDLKDLIIAVASRGLNAMNEFRSVCPEACAIFDEYLIRLKENNAVDFGLILTEVEQLFKQFPEIQKHYQRKWKHILIDEYQDTDFIQYNLHHLIEPDNLFCVGDSDQAIYAFRGATIDIILNFETDYFDSEIIELPLCYRCALSIVDSANSLIKNNKHRIEKSIIGAREEYGQHISTEEELNSILYAHEHRRGTHAVLSRTKKPLQAVARVLDQHDIGYVLVGQENEFYSLPEVKQFHSLLSLSVNPFDNLSFLRIRRLFKVSDSQYSTIRYNAVINETSHFQEFEKEIGKRIFTDEHQALNKSTLEYFSLPFANSGIITELVEKIIKYVHEENNNDIKDYLNWLQQRDVQDDLIDKECTELDKIKLMTIHASKGLEFETVNVIGMYEGHLPHKRAKTDLEIEEERRLFYVAITRAKDTLILSCKPEVDGWNEQKIKTEPSRFLTEIKR